MLGDLGKLIVAKGFKKLPKSTKSPDLVTLILAIVQGAYLLPYCINALEKGSRELGHKG